MSSLIILDVVCLALGENFFTTSIFLVVNMLWSSTTMQVYLRKLNLVGTLGGHNLKLLAPFKIGDKKK